MNVGMQVDVEFEQLYEREAARLWRAVLGYSGRPEIASDAVAEAFAQFLRGRERIRTPSAWLWRAAFRIAAGEMKHLSDHSPLAEDHLVSELPEGDALLPALASLPPRLRAVLVLRYYAGYEPREIGPILGTSPSTVRVQLMQGRRRLRAMLEASDD